MSLTGRMTTLGTVLLMAGLLVFPAVTPADAGPAAEDAAPATEDVANEAPDQASPGDAKPE